MGVLQGVPVPSPAKPNVDQLPVWVWERPCGPIDVLIDVRIQ
jgi:hypothetical protein